MVKPNIETIRLTQPYDLNETLYSGQAFRWRQLQSPKSTEGIWHEGLINSIRVRLNQVDNSINIESDPKHKEFVVHAVETYLRVEDDMSSIYDTMSSDQYLKRATAQYRGLHILRQDPWECLITFICSANNNIPRIRQLIELICNSAGKYLTDHYGAYRTFPTSSEINNLGEQGLRNLGFGFRAKYIAKAAVMESEGQIAISELRGKSYGEILESLISIPGVGDKVANCVMLFSMDCLEAFPVDVWIRRILRENYVTKKDKVPDSQLRTWSQNQFGPFAGYVNQYLFHKRRLA